MAYVKRAGIYQIKCLTNDKIYIGSTIDLRKREHRHFNELRKGEHCNIILQRSYDKYGKGQFIFEVIEDLDNMSDYKLLYGREDYYINKFDSKNRKFGYNIQDACGGDALSTHPDKENIIKRRSATLNAKLTKMTPEERSSVYGKFGAKNGMYGKTHTPEARKIMSDVNKGHSRNLGMKMSDETKQKLSKIASERVGEKNPFYGKHHSDEAKDKIRKARLGSKPTNARQINIDGVVYESATEAGRQLGVCTATILHRIKSPNKKFKGYEYDCTSST